MLLESPGGKPGATLALRAGAAAPVIARAPLAPLPASDRLLPLVEWVEFAGHRFGVARLHTVGEEHAVPCLPGGVLVDPPPRPPVRSIALRLVDGLGSDARDDPAFRELVGIHGPGSLLRLDPRRVTAGADHACCEIHELDVGCPEHRVEMQPRGVGSDAVERDRRRLIPLKVPGRSEEHTSELQSPCNLVCRLLLEKKKKHMSSTNRQITSVSNE